MGKILDRNKFKAERSGVFAQGVLTMDSRIRAIFCSPSSFVDGAGLSLPVRRV
jgi:hypothetical protein